MEVQYQREASHNYLVVRIETDREGYEARMAEENRIRGLLPLAIKERNGKAVFFYDITSRQPLARMAETRKIREDELRHLLLGLAAVLAELKKYLLSETHLLLKPDLVYLDPGDYTIFLCFVPGYEGDFWSELSGLMEYLLGAMSHDDRQGVVLAYELFQAVKQDNCSMENLLQILFRGEGKCYREQECGEETEPVRKLKMDPVEENKQLPGKKSLFSRLGIRRDSRQQVWSMEFPEEWGKEENHLQQEEKEQRTDTVMLRQTEKPVRKLVSITGDRGEIILEYFPFLLGKQEGLVDHVLKKDTISRLHARIDQTEQGYTVTDLNSTNGVRVGKQILQANETVELKMGDELYLADAGFLFL